MINNEILCKPIKRFDGYFVDMSGNVWSSKQKKYKKLSSNNIGKNNRYCKVRLSRNNKKKTLTVHRLVAETFLPNPNNYPVVMHMDDNPKNNCVGNLKWGTQLINTSSEIKQRKRQCLKVIKNVRKMCKLNFYNCSYLESYRQVINNFSTLFNFIYKSKLPCLSEKQIP